MPGATPGQVAPDSVSDQLFCFTDLMATFAAITQTELADEAGPDSFNQLGVLNGEATASARQSLLMKASSGIWAVRRGPWKLITGLGSGGFSEPRRVQVGPGDPAGQLYNLDQDRGETNNLYSMEPERVAELMSELTRIESHPSSRPAAVTH